MPEKNSWINFIKRLKEFISYVLGFFRQRKEKKQKRRYQKIGNEIKKGYNKIDKKKAKKKKDDVEKRLDNMF